MYLKIMKSKPRSRGDIGNCITARSSRSFYDDTTAMNCIGRMTRK